MTLKFCKDCNSILFIRKEGEKILRHCNNCNLGSVTDNNYLFKRNFQEEIADSNKKMYMASDPTLPRVNTNCDKCGCSEVISYLKNGDERALNNFYMCASCHTEWRD